MNIYKVIPVPFYLGYPNAVSNQLEYSSMKPFSLALQCCHQATILNVTGNQLGIVKWQ